MQKIIFCLILLCGVSLVSGCGNRLESAGMAADSGLSGILSKKNVHQTAQWENYPYDDFYRQAVSLGEINEVKGAIVPHHLLAGYLPATIFEGLKKQNPSIIVIFAPNHFGVGPGSVLTTVSDYQTQYGQVDVSHLAKTMIDEGVVKINEDGFENEHSIGGLVPFVAHSLPHAEILPIIFQSDTQTDTVDKVLEFLKKNLPSDTVFVASIDCSHYQTWPVAKFHDEYTQSVIHNFDFSNIYNTEIDSHPSLYAFMRMMEYYQTEKIAWEVGDNSARLSGRPNIDETTSHYASVFVKGGAESKPTASFLFFGDMMLDRNVKKAIDKNGADWIFTELAGMENRFFSGMNFVHANLEGPFADSRRKTSKEIAFRFDPILIPTLKKYNFNIFTVANNHSLDMSKQGLQESVAHLTATGIDSYGDGYGIGDQAIKIKESGGLKIAFVGFNDTYFRLDNKQVAATVRDAASRSDLVVVNIHWGNEYQAISNARQRELAHLMVDSGADIIIGHHPHVVEEMEIYQNRPIFYSLGNFVFDQYFSRETQEGLSVGVVASTSTISVSVFPLQSIHSQVRQMDYETGFRYMNAWTAQCRLGNYIFNNINNIKIKL